MRKIAIVFGDNDFHSTFNGVLECILSVHNYKGPLTYTKAEFVEYINRLAPICHDMFQLDGPSDSRRDRLAHTHKYVQITEQKLLLDKEVDEYVKNVGGMDNSSTFILDTYLIYPGSEPIYCV